MVEGGTSPAPLVPALIDDYRVAMTRVSPTDWSALRARVEAAERLGSRAFREGSRAAWEVVQVIEWRLQKRSSLRPTEPGDVLVLDTLYRIEESTLEPATLDPGLSPRQFCERLTDDISAFSAVGSPTIELMESGRLTRADWTYLGYQWLAPSGDFTRMIAIASLPLPHSFSRTMYSNLNDEGGRGTWEHAHQYLLEKFLGEFGVVAGDDEALLHWTVPEHLGMINAQNRLLWHSEPGWGLGSMYLYERLLPFELSRIRDGLLAIGVPADSLRWFDEHISVDPVHAEDWLGVVEQFLRTPEEQAIAYRAAIERGRWSRLSWDAIHWGWEQWKRTGVPPHVPAAELRAATGV